MSVQADPRSRDAAPTPAPRPRAWPLAGALAGLLGSIATLFLDSRVGEPNNLDYTITVADLPDLESGIMRVGGIVGYLAVGALVVFAALWHRRVVQRFGGSVGAAVVQYGLVGAIGTLTFAYGWKGALGNYGPGATEAGTYDDTGMYAYYILNDFGPFIAWLPALVALGGLAYMAFRERLVSRVLGGFALVLCAAGYLAVAATGVPGLPFVAAPGLFVACLWLSFGRSVITREVPA